MVSYSDQGEQMNKAERYIQKVGCRAWFVDYCLLTVAYFAFNAFIYMPNCN